MPLLRFDVIEGRSDEELKLLLDTAHEAMLEAFDVPERDRYQIVHTHKANEMIIEDTGLGLTRSNQVVVISVTSKTRLVDIQILPPRSNLYVNQPYPSCSIDSR